MLKESKANEEFEYQRLSPEEQKARGILGRLVGICADFIKPTRNDRKYSEQLWENVFNDPIMKEKIANKCCFGELGHPADRTETDMEKIAICLAEQPVKGSDGKLRAVFDILSTPNGKILKSLCDYGCNIGISSRGEGDLITDYDGQEAVDPETYSCECFDAVLIPAVKEARMKYVTESLEKTRYNKTLRTALKESLEKASEEDRKVMEETLNNLNIDLNESQELDEMAMPKLILDVMDTNTGEVIPPVDKKGPGMARAMATLIANKTRPNLEVISRRYEDSILTHTETVFKKVDNASEILTADKYTHVYINGDLDNIRYASKNKSSLDNSAAIAAFNNGDCIVLFYPRTPNANPPKAFKLNESLDESAVLNEEEIITNIDFDNIIDDLTNYYSHGWPLDMAKKSLALNKEFGLINQEQFNEILSNITANIDQDSEEEPVEMPTDDSEKNLDIDGVITDEAVDNNEVLVSELQESLKQKQELEQKLIGLQEKLSVCYAKEAKNEEEAVKYKETVRKLAEDSKKATALQAKVSLLEEKLSEAQNKEESLKTQLNEARDKVKFAAQKNVSLKESISKRGEETIKLSESLKSLQEELKQVKELNSSRDAEIKALKESYADKFTKAAEEAKTKEAEMQKTISTLNENLNAQKTEYTQKIEKSTKLIEKYKKATAVAVDKYINLQATRLGSSANEIKNRLPESYTFGDIDKACEDLQQYNLNMSKLPFNALSKKSMNENLKIKGMSSQNESILPANPGFDDDIDDDLMYLAGK